MRTKQDDVKMLAEAYNKVYNATRILKENLNNLSYPKQLLQKFAYSFSGEGLDDSLIQEILASPEELTYEDLFDMFEEVDEHMETEHQFYNHSISDFTSVLEDLGAPEEEIEYVFDILSGYGLEQG